MIAWLAVSLEAGSIGAAAALLASAGSIVALRWIRFVRTAAHRADAAFLLGLTPMIVGACMWMALILPSALHSIGFRMDHCVSHAHHAHLCALHGGGHHLWLVVLGAVALVTVLFRGVMLARAQLRSMRLVGALERLGVAEVGSPFPIVVLPGSPWICLAAGGWRRRVLISAAIAGALRATEVNAAVLHEQAHLSRKDPLLKMVLAWAGLFSAPIAAVAVQQVFGDAAEEASDAEAAACVGPIAVAESLIAMSRLTRRTAPATCMAFGASTLERRVSALLGGPLQVHPSRSMPLALGGASAVAVVAAAGAERIHHFVETLFQLLG